MKTIFSFVIVLFMMIIISLFIGYSFPKLQLVLLSIILLLIYCLLVFLVYRMEIYWRERKKSIVLFLKKIDQYFVNYNIHFDRVFNFNRIVKHKNKRIPLGTVIFDDTSHQILIYETFWSKDENLICLPDIRIFKYQDLIGSKIMLDNDCLSIKELKKIFYLMHEKKTLFQEVTLELSIKNHFFEKIVLRLSSINDYELFCKIYLEIMKIITRNKK